jgi:hypothetical protein
MQIGHSSCWVQRFKLQGKLKIICYRGQLPHPAKGLFIPLIIEDNVERVESFKAVIGAIDP